MNMIENQVPRPGENDDRSVSRSSRIQTVAWLAGVTAVVALGSLRESASFGVGLAVIAVSGMVAFVSYLILRE